MTPPPSLTVEIALIMGVLAVTTILFVTEKFRVDVVAMAMMPTLPLLGLITPAEAFSGLSSNAVVSIIAVVIIGAGLDRTGVMNKVAAPIIGFGGTNVNRLIVGVSGSVGIISSFMQNIGAAALFLPATMRVSKQTGVPLSRLLMPMGYCAILGGTVTLVGSSPLILLNDLLATAGLPEFDLFSVTPIGLTLLASGIVYFLLLGRYVLPHRIGAAGEDLGGALRLLQQYGAAAKPFELVAPPDFAHNGKTLEELQMRRTFLVTVAAIKPANAGKINVAPTRSHRLHAGDRLAVLGHPNNVAKLVAAYGFIQKPYLDVFEEELSENNAGLVEGIIAPRSDLAGTTLRKARFVSRFGISPIALYREGKVFRAGHSDIPLKPGDALLMHGSWSAFAKLKSSPDLLIPAGSTQEVFAYDKAKRAIFAFAVALSLVALRGSLAAVGVDISLAVCLMTGAVTMILLDVISVDDAYRSVEWRSVFLLAGLIPLGVATEKTGAAAYIAHGLTSAMGGDVSPLALLTVIAVITTGFTLVISNVGATVLLAPLAINMAYGAGADPRMAALVVGLAASNSFLLPTHQVNALLMGPGRYRTVDYLRAGGGMSVIFILVTVFGLWAFYGIAAPPLQ
jgi:di/tricarboxylate transporter